MNGLFNQKTIFLLATISISFYLIVKLVIGLFVDPSNWGLVYVKLISGLATIQFYISMFVGSYYFWSYHVPAIEGKQGRFLARVVLASSMIFFIAMAISSIIYY